jgi:signal transduction histidine kinase
MIARFPSLQARFLASLVLSVAAALATVAIMARWSMTVQFEQYVQGNRSQMQQVAKQLAADTGQRVVVANAAGRVFLDSSGQLLDQVLDPGAPSDVQMVQGDVHLIQGPGPTDAMYSVSKAGPPMAGPATFRIGVQTAAPPFNPEELYLNSVSSSLLVGVLVGGAVALALAFFFSRGIVQSVQALTDAAGRMANGHLDQRVTVRSKDEIGQLSVAFNAMAEGLTRTERLRRTMVADVAHELRTPLTNLRGYLEALRDGVAEPGPEVLTSLYEESVLLSQLVDDLQDLALSDAGQLTLQHELADADELLVSAVRAVQPEAARRDLTLTLVALDGSVDVWADVRRIGQVLRNLLANALAYTPAGGSVTVSAAATNNELTVFVSDSGQGIPPEHLANVFERFYRVDSSRTRTTGGAGIGLAVVKQLVEAHGGNVDVRSVVGRGTTFSFTLPLTGSGQTHPHGFDFAGTEVERHRAALGELDGARVAFQQVHLVDPVGRYAEVE